MHKSDVINLQNDDIHLQTVQFDSGDIQSNYFNVMAYAICKPTYAGIQLTTSIPTVTHRYRRLMFTPRCMLASHLSP